jgi:hypothetical protein
MARPKKLKNNDEVTVVNNTVGKLIYISNKTGFQMVLDGYGAIDKIPFGELITMKSSQPKFINDAWLIILDEEAIKQLKLEKQYENIIKPDDLDSFYDLNDKKMGEMLDNMPNQMKETIAKITKQKIENRELNDLFKIKLIEEKLGIELLS